MPAAVLLGLWVLLGWIFATVPIGPEWQQWWPPFLVIFIIWMVIHRPAVIGVVGAWFIGLSLDFLQGSPLGSQAFALAVVAYGLGLLRFRARHLHWVGQALFVGAAVAVFTQVSLWLRLVLGYDLNPLLALANAVTSIFVWPIVAVVMDRVFSRLSKAEPV